MMITSPFLAEKKVEEILSKSSIGGGLKLLYLFCCQLRHIFVPDLDGYDNVHVTRKGKGSIYLGCSAVDYCLVLKEDF